MLTEEVRHIVERSCKKVAGSVEPALVSATALCLSQSNNREDMLKVILPLVSTQSLAVKYVDRIFDKLKINPTTGQMFEGSHRKRKHERGKTKDEVDEIVSVPNVNSVNPSDIQMMMDAAKKELERKKQQMGITAEAVPVEVCPSEAILKANRAVELQNRIRNGMMATGLITPMGGGAGFKTPIFPGMMTPFGDQSVEPMPCPLVLDKEGQTLDASTGQAFNFTPRMPTLKANIRARKREELKQIMASTSQKEAKPETPTTGSAHFDSRLPTKTQKSTRSHFNFYEPGKFTNQARNMRLKQQLEKLQGQISAAAKRTGIEAAAKLALVQPAVQKSAPVPNVEWWDAVIHPPGSQSRRYIGITNLVEHPNQLKPPNEHDVPPPLPIYLTKREQRKLRRQRRREAEREKTEKIRLGLEPPPEPKVRISNLMRVLGSEATQDPTKVEAHVRAQMAKRQRAHQLANAARKLTSEQKRAKKLKKVRENTTLGVSVSVYRVVDLSSPAQRFKIVQNCKQLLMTGLLILSKDVNVIIVEGGSAQQRKYQQLMLRRIKWNEQRRRPNTEDSKKPTNRCDLVWEGIVRQRSFGEMKIKSMQPTQAREYCKRVNAEQYWDLSHSQSILQSSEN